MVSTSLPNSRDPVAGPQKSAGGYAAICKRGLVSVKSNAPQPSPLPPSELAQEGSKQGDSLQQPVELVDSDSPSSTTSSGSDKPRGLNGPASAGSLAAGEARRSKVGIFPAAPAGPAPAQGPKADFAVKNFRDAVQKPLPGGTGDNPAPPSRAKDIAAPGSAMQQHVGSILSEAGSLKCAATDNDAVLATHGGAESTRCEPRASATGATGSLASAPSATLSPHAAHSRVGSGKGDVAAGSGTPPSALGTVAATSARDHAGELLDGGPGPVTSASGSGSGTTLLRLPSNLDNVRPSSITTDSDSSRPFSAVGVATPLSSMANTKGQGGAGRGPSHHHPPYNPTRKHRGNPGATPTPQGQPSASPSGPTTGVPPLPLPGGAPPPPVDPGAAAFRPVPPPPVVLPSGQLLPSGQEYLPGPGGPHYYHAAASGPHPPLVPIVAYDMGGMGALPGGPWVPGGHVPPVGALPYSLPGTDAIAMYSPAALYGGMGPGDLFSPAGAAHAGMAGRYADASVAGWGRPDMYGVLPRSGGIVGGGTAGGAAIAASGGPNGPVGMASVPGTQGLSGGAPPPGQPPHAYGNGGQARQGPRGRVGNGPAEVNARQVSNRRQKQASPQPQVQAQQPQQRQQQQQQHPSQQQQQQQQPQHQPLPSQPQAPAEWGPNEHPVVPIHTRGLSVGPHFHPHPPPLHTGGDARVPTMAPRVVPQGVAWSRGQPSRSLLFQGVPLGLPESELITRLEDHFGAVRGVSWAPIPRRVLQDRAKESDGSEQYEAQDKSSVPTQGQVRGQAGQDGGNMAADASRCSNDGESNSASGTPDDLAKVSSDAPNSADSVAEGAKGSNSAATGPPVADASGSLAVGTAGSSRKPPPQVTSVTVHFYDLRAAQKCVQALASSQTSRRAAMAPPPLATPTTMATPGAGVRHAGVSVAAPSAATPVANGASPCDGDAGNEPTRGSGVPVTMCADAVAPSRGPEGASLMAGKLSAEGGDAAAGTQGSDGQNNASNDAVAAAACNRAITADWGWRPRDVFFTVATAHNSGGHKGAPGIGPPASPVGPNACTTSAAPARPVKKGATASVGGTAKGSVEANAARKGAQANASPVVAKSDRKVDRRSRDDGVAAEPGQEMAGGASGVWAGNRVGGATEAAVSSEGGQLAGDSLRGASSGQDMEGGLSQPARKGSEGPLHPSGSKGTEAQGTGRDSAANAGQREGGTCAGGQGRGCQWSSRSGWQGVQAGGLDQPGHAAGLRPGRERRQRGRSGRVCRVRRCQGGARRACKGWRVPAGGLLRYSRRQRGTSRAPWGCGMWQESHGRIRATRDAPARPEADPPSPRGGRFPRGHSPGQSGWPPPHGHRGGRQPHAPAGCPWWLDAGGEPGPVPRAKRYGHGPSHDGRARCRRRARDGAPRASDRPGGPQLLRLDPPGHVRRLFVPRGGASGGCQHDSPRRVPPWPRNDGSWGRVPL
eukprot:jgi/Mesvir1/10199/Mv18325-RA.1